jgi:CheY-like chemotaxis protein
MKVVLVADDSRAIRNILSRILVRAGFEVVQVENGRAGITLHLGFNDYVTKPFTEAVILEKLETLHVPN